MRCSYIMLFLALSACDQEEVQAPELPIRAIKYMTIGELATQEKRILAGIVEAGTNSNVAFEIGGRVLEISARIGDTISPGQPLARLDAEPYRLQSQQAENSLKQALANYQDAKAKYLQQKPLWDQRLTTKTSFDTAVANLRNAKGQVGIARSQLELKRRDANRTRLIAPFGGRVSERFVEPFEEVTAGQAIFALQTEGEDEVSVSVPEGLVSRIHVGQSVSVSIPAINDETLSGLFTEISPKAGDANAYPAKIRLSSVPPGLLAGMSAQITLRLDLEEGGTAYSVPTGALKPSASGPSEAIVYVFDTEASVVRERSVRVAGIDGNSPQVIGELKPGDIIATAGVGHMFDGMEVRLLDPSKPF